MAKKIQAWAAYGPKISLGDPMTEIDIIENMVAGTNQSKGSVLAVLAEMDVQIEAGLKAGRVVRLPNGTRLEPIGKKDGSIDIGVRISAELEKKVNSEFRGKWLNSENKGKTESEMIALWNKDHPDDLIPVED
jgi:hypothetical protein